MDRKPRKFQPQAAELESKLLLSVAPTSTSAPADAEMSTLDVRSGTTPATAVTDVVHGRYHAGTDNQAADAPYDVHFSGNGHVDGLGRARLAGDLYIGGYRVAGAPQVSGTLTLSNARGSVQLELTGTGGVSDVPNHRFATTASVVKATGAYRGFQRAGTVTVDFGSNRVHPGPSGAIGGAASVTLGLKPLVK